MIDYELALELKNAGLILEWKPSREYVFPIDRIPIDLSIGIPTLEELIEACGKTYKEGEVTYEFVLLWIDDTWYAGYSDKDHTRPKIKDGKGTTPEEAVTRLYLSLHK